MADEKPRPKRSRSKPLQRKRIHVSLIDEKAGVEHFGRRIPDRMDMILGVLDCTREPVSIARRVSGFSKATGMDNLQCDALLIERIGFFVHRNRIRDGACPECGTRIDGIGMTAP